MKIFNKLSLSILFVGLIGLFTGCDLTPAVAPAPTYDGEATHTIAELLAMHEIGSSDSYIHLEEDGEPIIISGVITTSDEHGNCYKYINIEDGTGGIQIKVNSSSLYPTYRVGQRIFVVCNGLDLGDYRKLPQLGMWANESMQGIPTNKVNKYIHLHEMPSDFEPVITLTSIPSSADAVPFEYYNRLVRIEGATFVEGGNATYATASAASSHDINVAGGGTITLRTSNYADFYNTTLPEGTGTVIGILTRYNNYIQLVIRDLNDVQGFTIPAHWETLFSVSDYANAFNQGWTKTTVGAEWTSISNSSFNGFGINAGNTETNSMLVSPVINLSGTSSAKLSFKHRAPQGGSESNMKCFYSTNGGEWKPIPVQTFNSNFINFEYELPAEALSSSFRVAFQYEGSGSSWYIENIAISALVN